jgi:hypothetical protein
MKAICIRCGRWLARDSGRTVGVNYLKQRCATAIWMLCCIVVLIAAAADAAAAATPKVLWNACRQGTSAGQCAFADGVAADPSTGHVYVLDAGNDRIDVFSAWGAFRESWGWGVSNGAATAQTCGPAASPPSSSCQPGIRGNGPGQLAGNSLNVAGDSTAIAVDPSGDLYVYEGKTCTSGGGCEAAPHANRVQKFSPQGDFVFMFGREVNLTKVALRQQEEANSEPVTVTAQEENLCTAASGNDCGPGVQGSGAGEFGTGPLSSTGPAGPQLVVGSDGTVYVGGQERIQEFNAVGEYQKSVVVPGTMVQALAVEENGDLFVGNAGHSDLVKLSPAGSTLCAVSVANPKAIAGAPLEGAYVFSRNGTSEVLRVEPDCSLASGSVFVDSFDESTGIAVNTVTTSGEVGIYVVNTSGSNSFVRAYFPPPDKPTPFDQPPEVPPSITAQFASFVGGRNAMVGALINPHFFADTSYYVEYGIGKCSEGGCSRVPFGSLSLGVGRTSEPAATARVELTGLLSETTYHYRFVAESEGGGPVRGLGGDIGKDGAEGAFSTFPEVLSKPACGNDAFRIGPAAGLADCRTYEMVSPVDKEGGDVATGAVTIPDRTLAESSVDGERMTFSSLRAFAEPQAAPLISQYFASRGTDGWFARSISPPRANPPIFGPGASGQYKGFDESLCSAWLLQETNLPLVAEPSVPDRVTNAYRRNSCGAESYELLTAVTPSGVGSGGLDPELYIPNPQAHSIDGLHTVYRADAALTKSACPLPGIFQVYEESQGGALRLVSVLPGGSPACTHSSAGTMEGVTDGFREASMTHAVSNDGSRVFWTDSGNSTPINENSFSGIGPGTIYLRLNATQAPSKLVGEACTEPTKACTVPVSKSAESRFWQATPNGAKALYTTGEELFEYDVASAESHLIAKGVSGVVGSSEDLSRAFFISTEAIAGSGKNSSGKEAVAGQPNIYLAEGTGRVFVGTLDTLEGSTTLDQARRPSSPADVQPFLRTSRVSPNGLHLAFTSAAQQTTYDNSDVSSDEPDTELYLYDVVPGAAGSLACVSCNPSGSRPVGRQIPVTGSSTNPYWAAATLPGWAEQLKPTRLLTNDGNRLYFQAFDSLVPADRNNGAQDVYEWERAGGKAECQAKGAELYAPSAGGCLSLISSGQSSSDSELLDASEGGKDVFFTTEESLLPQDPGQVDVYDAREGGGFPPIIKPTPCQGEGCQAPPARNNPVVPGSTARGPGNLLPKCPKGTHRVKKKGKSSCVRKAKKKNKVHKNKKNKVHKNKKNKGRQERRSEQ